ncbi:MAG: ABC transporter ATP-binding protein [Clostridiales bacterium]|nr:ABC transporter ATP-binding protein [Clostridiales bacterium]
MENQFGFFDALKFLKRYVMAHKGNFIMFYLGWLFKSFLIVIIPILFGEMIDEIVYNNNRDTFFQIGLMVGGLYLIAWILYFFIYRQHNYLMTKFAYHIKKDLFEHFLVMKAKILVNIDEGALMALFLWYPMECVHLLVRGVLHQINRIITVILVLGAIVRINLIMGIIVLVMVGISIILTKVVGEKMKGQALKQRLQNEKNQSWILEMLSGMTQIRLLSAQPYVNDQLEQKMNHIFGIRKKTNQINTTYSNLLIASRVILQILLYAYIATLAFQDKITIGEITMVLSYFTLLTGHITEIYDEWKNAMERVPIVQKISDFLKTPTEEEWIGKDTIEKEPLGIALDRVTFGYEEGNRQDSSIVLNNISFMIQPGKRIGLVGDSGCGKSTIANLLLGLFEPQQGRILLQNRDIKDFQLESIRERVGLISQQVSIMDGSIRDNLRVVREEATLEDMIKACQCAGIWDYIQTLPNGLDTIIGRNGMELSGGEKQRISIARIYLKQPEVIIFDESTSALDFDTEKQLMSYWEQILQDHTVIIISHRFTTLSTCEEIYVMKNGRIQEHGDLEHLMQKDTYFSQLFRIKEAVNV